MTYDVGNPGPGLGQAHNKRQRISKGHSKMCNTEKLATKGTQYEDTQKHNTICGGHHYTQANSYNVNKIGVPLQTPGCSDEPNIDRFHEEIVMDI